MKLDESSEMNINVLKYLGQGKKGQPPMALPDAVQNPYHGQGSHPDIVERVWDQIGAALPTDCRCLVYGVPALVRPISGIIFVLCGGTVYYLRLVSELTNTARQAGMKTYIKWSYGGDMDTQRDLGPDWFLGKWLADEIHWCNSVYKELGMNPEPGT